MADPPPNPPHKYSATVEDEIEDIAPILEEEHREAKDSAADEQSELRRSTRSAIPELGDHVIERSLSATSSLRAERGSPPPDDLDDIFSGSLSKMPSFQEQVRRSREEKKSQDANNKLARGASPDNRESGKIETDSGMADASRGVKKESNKTDCKSDDMKARAEAWRRYSEKRDYYLRLEKLEHKSPRVDGTTKKSSLPVKPVKSPKKETRLKASDKLPSRIVPVSNSDSGSSDGILSESDSSDSDDDTPSPSKQKNTKPTASNGSANRARPAEVESCDDESDSEEAASFSPIAQPVQDTSSTTQRRDDDTFASAEDDNVDAEHMKDQQDIVDTFEQVVRRTRRPPRISAEFRTHLRDDFGHNLFRRDQYGSNIRQHVNNIHSQMRNMKAKLEADMEDMNAMFKADMEDMKAKSEAHMKEIKAKSETDMEDMSNRLKNSESRVGELEKNIVKLKEQRKSRPGTKTVPVSGTEDTDSEAKPKKSKKKKSKKLSKKKTVKPVSGSEDSESEAKPKKAKKQSKKKTKESSSEHSSDESESEEKPKKKRKDRSRG
ncbi:hypothetical protein LTR15_008971 [Elasticomyces elasticus]|nr:hypothetical protein LTR15_008971 [Elasticomyces elasticus]